MLSSLIRHCRRVALALVGGLLLSMHSNIVPAAAQDFCTTHLGWGQAARGAALSGAVDILSWNIQKASNPGWERELAAILGEVNLAFIQEASTQANILAVTPTPMFRAFSAGYTTARTETGVLTLSTSAPSMHCHYTNLEPWLRTPKATGVTEFPLAGRPDRLLAVNLHAINFDLGLAGFREQFQALARLLAEHRGPAILAGDLNTWNGARQTLVDGVMARQGLKPLTFTPDLRTTAFGRALDHIYVRGLQAEFARVIPVSSSDHNALRARLRIL